jgi:hypothetical protein
MKICPVGDELFLADRQTDERTDMTKRKKNQISKKKGGVWGIPNRIHVACVPTAQTSS